ncbi:hypothetical protein [Emticicia sp. BO119]|uniref:hypothetical protein n=1 Tax=Emticicia sp. BO119 TaxID=2757768 RepID=UPI0015F04B27|nr:hypothetical protein [Emticicia sp. BO119]MBA4848991.1 hypothetical protein [Emticicia sp. BO119]
MDKPSFPIGGYATLRKSMPVIDFHKTFALCKAFRIENNVQRSRQLQALIDQGHDLKQLRQDLSRLEYEAWEAKQGVFPHIGGTVETSMEKLIAFFMHEFKRGKVYLNNQIRFTWSYFRTFYNGEECLSFARISKNTLRNHFNKISHAYKSLFENKYRGQLCLPDYMSVNCVVLTFQPDFIQFTNPKHTAVLSAKEEPLKKKKVPQNTAFMEKIQATLSTFSGNNPHSEDRTGQMIDVASLSKALIDSFYKGT